MEKDPTKIKIFDCSVIDIGKIHNREGNISIIENDKNNPFSVRRVFYIYDIPGGEARGAHAHKECHQLLFAASGSFDIELFDGTLSRTVSLSRPYHGLHIPPGIWASEKNFSSGSVCLVLASEKYNENDYIRNYKDYLNFKTLNA